ncbi:MAG: DsbA family protein [Colwellia sp.]|nr:DsbA family protein [Colwellia sp.]MCW8864103.1 DsbA family protein [Colwellia sp.]MCW9082057.1 DsbA family protein [Colwellia sp.]
MTTPLSSEQSSVQLFFLYDSHCPWSFVTTPLVNEIHKAFPQITLNLWHSALFSSYNGTEVLLKKQDIRDVEQLADMHFSTNYQQTLEQSRDSTLATNLMTWAQLKTPNLALPLLNALQKAHFVQGNSLKNQDDLAKIIAELKLSPPAKVFKSDKLSKDAQELVEEVFALQEIIATQAIPALLLAIDDELILLNHNFYLTQPEAIVEAVQLELNKHHLNANNT